jgi:hypothetical protein
MDRIMCKYFKEMSNVNVRQVLGRNRLISFDTEHTENDASNNSSIVACVLVAAVKFLPSLCLTTIVGYTCRYPD